MARERDKGNRREKRIAGVGKRSSALAERSEPAWSFRIKSERALLELPEFVLSSELLHGSGSASREAPAKQGTKGERLGARSRCGLAEDAFTFWEARDRVGDGSPCGLPASAFAQLAAA
jgi:hypothetical protein